MRVLTLLLCVTLGLGDVEPAGKPPEAPPPPPRVGLQACGSTAHAQGWQFDAGTLQLVSSNPSDRTTCLIDVESGNLVRAQPCAPKNLQYQWIHDMVPPGFRIKNKASNRCLNYKKKVAQMGLCDNTSIWWDDADDVPTGMLRTIGDPLPKAEGHQQQCLSVPLAALPWKKQDSSLCRSIMESLPTVNISKGDLPIIKTHGVTIDMGGLHLYLGNSAKKNELDVCGVLPDGPDKGVGTLRLTVTIPSISFHLDHFHFVKSMHWPAPSIHGSGDATGHLATHIEVPFKYNRKTPSLHCSDFEMTVSDVGLALHGGGAWHGIVADLTGMIKKQIQAQVPKIAEKKVCPLINGMIAKNFKKCYDKASAWVPILLCCLTGGPGETLEVMATPETFLV